MAERQRIVAKFRSLFNKALTDNLGTKEKTIREKEADYYTLTRFINGLSNKTYIDACLDEYLKIYTKYPEADRRSKFIFALLLQKSIDNATVQDRYIDDLSRTLADNQQPFTSKIRQRYEDLEEKEKIEIQGALKYKQTRKKERSTILDALRKAYYYEQKKEATFAELAAFDSAPDTDLEKKFIALWRNCRGMWGKNDIEKIEKGIMDFIAFVSGQKDVLRLFQILKWSRDIVVQVPLGTDIDQAGNLLTIKRPSHDALDSECYFQCVYWIFRYAIVHGYLRNYSGFNAEEGQFFFDPLSSDYYYENYLNRFQNGIKKAHLFKKASVLFLRLLIFAKMNDAIMPNSEEALRIKEIRASTSKVVLEKRSFDVNVGPPILRGKVKIGTRYGRAILIYFDEVKDIDDKSFYVEFIKVKSILFKINANRLADLRKDSFYVTLWENAQNLLKFIELLYAFIGYTFSFLTGGFAGLFLDVSMDIAVGEYADAANLGPEARIALGLATSAVAPVGVRMVPKRGTVSVDIDMPLNRGLAELANDETRVLGRTESLVQSESRGVRVEPKAQSTAASSYTIDASDRAVRHTRTVYAAAKTGEGSVLPGPAEDFPFAGGGAIPKPEVPNRLYRIMSIEEATEALKTGRIPGKVRSSMNSKYLSMDSDYVMLFREKELQELADRGEKMVKRHQESLENLKKRLKEVEDSGNVKDATKLRQRLTRLESKIEKKTMKMKAQAEPIVQDWFAAPGQKVVVEVELAPGTIDDMLKRAVPKELIRKYQGKNVFMWNFERGYGRNIAIPPWQLDRFNQSIIGIRLHAYRGINPSQRPTGTN